MLARSIYLGPHTARWTPGTWLDLQEAASGGLIDESHWLDLKREVPTTKGSNAELARDLASLAVDGGLLLIGVDEDDLGRGGDVVGTALAGLPERVDAIARSRIDPPLVVRSHPPIEDPERPGFGCLLVEVPPSAQAPHMVDHIYYGRGDRGKIRLSDIQVRQIVERQYAGRADLNTLLDELAAHDPVPDPADRANGHLYLIVHPVTAREDALVDMCIAPATRELIAAVRGAREARTGPSFSPDLGDGTWSRRSDGMACLNGISDAGVVREDSLMELTIREDGTIGLLYGRATKRMNAPWHYIGESEATPAFNVLFPNIVLGVVHGSLALAADLADNHSGYQGQWQIGLRLTGLRDAYAHDYAQSGNTDVTQPYNRDTYERTITAHTLELADAAATITERLIAPLLRGLAVDRRYLPYATVPTDEVAQS